MKKQTRNLILLVVFIVALIGISSSIYECKGSSFEAIEIAFEKPIDNNQEIQWASFADGNMKGEITNKEFSLQMKRPFIVKFTSKKVNYVAKKYDMNCFGYRQFGTTNWTNKIVMVDIWQFAHDPTYTYISVHFDELIVHYKTYFHYQSKQPISKKGSIGIFGLIGVISVVPTNRVWQRLRKGDKVFLKSKDELKSNFLDWIDKNGMHWHSLSVFERSRINEICDLYSHKEVTIDRPMLLSKPHWMSQSRFLNNTGYTVKEIPDLTIEMTDVDEITFISKRKK